jgi:glycosyltransferase involved in cell wall biosynthesis
MQKTLIIFSFYFNPDLSAGSFRNSTLIEELENQSGEKVAKVIITTKPNRYKEFRTSSKNHEKKGSTEIYRIQIPDHQSGIIDQIKAYTIYFYKGIRIALKYNPTMVYASTSRLFTGFLGAFYARLSKADLYLDVRDIFLDTITDIYQKSVLKYFLFPIISIVEWFTMSSTNHINLISPGFKDYFIARYPERPYSDFSNGIDTLFLNSQSSSETILETEKTIVYAGNIGEGQGLHIFIPGLAKMLPEYSIMIIGDGGAKQKLEEGIKNLSNVKILPPMSRENVLEYYEQAKYTLIHLNDNEAFKKVLPSKVFELAAINKPILAGVDGYAAQFMADNVNESIIFKPGDFEEAVRLIKSYQYVAINRDHFKLKYSRKNINMKMSESILSYVK